jgi:hypothetical protein
MKFAWKGTIGKHLSWGGVGCKTVFACVLLCPYSCLPVCKFDLDVCYSLLCFSMLIGSPHRIFPSSSTRAKTPSRGMMQSPAL